MNNVIKAAVSTLVAMLVFAIYWVGGGEFERGENMAFTLVFAIFAWVYAYFAPHWED